MRTISAVENRCIRALVMSHEKAILGEMKDQGGVIAAFGDGNEFRVEANARSRSDYLAYALAERCNIQMHCHSTRDGIRDGNFPIADAKNTYRESLEWAKHREGVMKTFLHEIKHRPRSHS
jgi:hypothetical protein